MATFNFESLNTNYAFELPEGLWNKSNFIKVGDALKKYYDEDASKSRKLAISEVVPCIAFGITKIDKDEHPDAISDRSAWVATEEEIINVPGWQLPVIEGLLKERDAVVACKNGEFGVQFEEYEGEFGTHVRINFKNI